MNELLGYISSHIYVTSAIAFGFIILIFNIILIKIFKKHQPKAFLGIALSYLAAPFSIILLLLIVGLPIAAILDSPIFDHGLKIAIIVAFGWLAINFVLFGNHWLKIKFDVNKLDNIRERRIHTQALFVKRILIIGIVFITIALILLSFPRVQAIGAAVLATAGVLGGIVVFTAQHSLTNILAGLQIAFTQPIRIDDVVVVENEWGKIEEISLTYVVVRIWDSRRLILPINYFLEKPFQNWSRTTADLLGTSMIYTDYDVDLNQIRNELARIAKVSPLWDGAVCKLQVTDLTDKTMELRALVSARNSSDLWDLRCDVREGLIMFIKSHFPNSLPKNRLEVAMDKNFNHSTKEEKKR